MRSCPHHESVHVSRDEAEGEVKGRESSVTQHGEGEYNEGLLTT